MKKKNTKKQAKLSKAAPKKVSPMDELRGQIDKVRTQNMRLTQEFDRLATRVAGQGDLLFRIHQMLQTKKMMPYEPPNMTIDTITKEEKGYPLQSPPHSGRPVSVIFGNMKPEIKDYTVLAKIQQTTVGHLSGDWKWTFDPRMIARFKTKEEANQALATMTLPEGAKAHIEEHRG